MFLLLHDYKWDKDKYSLVKYTSYNITTKIDRVTQLLLFCSPYKSRILVGAAVNLANQVKEIMKQFQERVVSLTFKLH